MIPLRGLPDLSQPVEADGFRLFPAWEEAGWYLYLPPRLEVAPSQHPTGGLDFRVELGRGQNPFLPPQPYGVVDFRLASAPFTAQALAILRQLAPAATVAPAPFWAGCLHLKLIDGHDQRAAEFEAPVPLAANGLDSIRYVRRLTQEGVTLLKRVLQEGTLTFAATVELELWGVAPRLPARLDFRPADVLAALAARADSEGRLLHTTLIDFWRQDVADLPLLASDGFDMAERDLLAHTLADWTAADLATFVPSALAEGHPTFRLRPPADAQAAVPWDLRQGKAVPQIILLTLDPFQAAQQVVASQGLQSMYCETVVPSLETGVRSIYVATNLPVALRGALVLEVNLLAPPHPPQRFQPLTASLLLDEPDRVQVVNWRFSPAEPLAYQYSTLALVKGDTGSERLNSPATDHADDHLLLSVADFPLAFVPVSASPALLGLATIQGICRYADPESGGTVEIPFVLTDSAPAVTLCLRPEAASGAELELCAVAPESGLTLPLGTLAARGASLDLFSLREYGTHTVEIEAVFDRDLPLIALDLLPESAAGQLNQAQSLAFMPFKTQDQWSYFAATPFQAGYRYRRHDDGAAEGGWSAVQSPFERLVLRASEWT